MERGRLDPSALKISGIKTHGFGDFLPMIPRIAKVQLGHLGVFVIEVQIVLFGEPNSPMELLGDLGRSFIDVAAPGLGMATSLA
jgi:hypothetical protein